MSGKAKKTDKFDGMEATAKKRKKKIKLIWGVLTFIILLVVVLNNTLFSDQSNQGLRLMPREVKVTGKVLGIAFIFFLFVYLI